MADEAPKAVGRLRTLLAGVSSAAWIAWGTFFGLLSLTLFAWFLAWNNPLWVPWGSYLTLTRGGWLLGLAIAACLAEYLLFRIWFDETPLPNQDLRTAWAAGLRKMHQDAIDARERPCFLILDPVDACERWFDACGVRVQTPDAPADSQVRWYFGEDSLFLVVRRLGFLGPLARELDEVRRRPQRYLATSPVWSAAVPSALAGIAATTDTVSADSGIPSEFVNIDVEAVREELQSAAANRHSDFSDPTGESGYEEEWNVADVQLSSTEIARQSRRLSEVCRRLAACRRPVVPVNGVCVLLPDGMFSSLRGAGVRLGQALRHDLRLLQDELQIVAPVSIVLTGAEQDDGVVELIRRGGPEGEKSGGGGEFGLASGSLRTSADGLGRFCESLVQTLQQKVGRKLRDPRSVGRPGAESLFRLLCSLRGERACELQALVTQAFSGPDNREPDVLAGLSLAATGEQPTQRAFARSTYRNLLSNQEFVEWTRRGGRLERQLWWWAGACGSLSVLATVGLIVLLVTGR